MILERIVWPSGSADSDDDNSTDGESESVRLENQCRVAGFIREYIENGK